MNTSNRYVPAGSTAVRNKSGTAVAYLYETAAARPCAIGYRGRAINPTIQYYYSSEARRAESVAEFLRRADEIADHKEQQKAAKKAKLAQPHGLKVGDVLISMWGYDQTNIDYYQVTKLIGGRTVEIREIASQSDDSGYMQGDCVPAPGRFIGSPMRKKVSEYDTVRITSFSSASKVESRDVGGMRIYQEQHWTAYA